MDDEERYGAGLREMMLAVDVPPPKADVPGAVRVARRRDQRRTVALAALSVLVVAVAVVGYATTGPRRAGPEAVGGSPSGPAARCPVAVLETLPGGPTPLVAADPTGRYFVGYHQVGQETKVVLWTDGRPEELDVKGVPVAVNVKGVVIGYSGADDTARAWVYRNGYTTQLPRPSGWPGSNVTAINARGDIVGWAMKGGLDVNLPLFWPSDQPDKVRTLSAPANLGHKGVSSMRATGINDDQTIVGTIREVPVSWSPDGTVHQLPLPAGYDYGNPLHLRGTYAYGTVAKTGNEGQPVARWDLASGQVSVVTKVSHRVVDGTPSGWTLASDPDTTVELIDPNGAATPLLPPDKGGTLMAYAISDDARTIVGTAGEEGGTQVVWRC